MKSENKESKKCIICNKTFSKKKNGNKARSSALLIKESRRRHDSVTCSPKCSSEWKNTSSKDKELLRRNENE